MRGNKEPKKSLYITVALLDSDFNPSSHQVSNATRICKVEHTNYINFSQNTLKHLHVQFQPMAYNRIHFFQPSVYSEYRHTAFISF